MGKVYVVGDVHGCIDEFKELIDTIGASSDDRIVCLGDFMDKGPDGAACVKFARQSGLESVMGNHEERHIRWRKHELARAKTGKKNPMKHMSEQDQGNHKILDDEDMAWITGLPTTIDLGNGWVAAHAGFLPNISVADQHPNDVMRVRWVKDGKFLANDYSKPELILEQPEGATYWATQWTGPEHVVYGHEPFSLSTPKLTIHAGVQTWGIDTGVVHGGRLTALVLPTLELVQIPARRKYCEVLVPIAP